VLVVCTARLRLTVDSSTKMDSDLPAMRTLMKANFRNLQKKRPRESENVSPSSPHLEWVLCSVLTVVFRCY